MKLTVSSYHLYGNSLGCFILIRLHCASAALLQYFKVRRVLNMVSGVCFLIYIIIFPALYFSLPASPGEDLSYILYAPLSVCLIIQIICASMILVSPFIRNKN
jgi:hypothetical protein